MKAKFSKLCSLILAVVMMIGCLNINATAASDGSMSENLKGIVEFLRLLEIIPDYYDYNVNVNEKVSRADFAAATAKLINCTEYSGNPYYYDVPQTHWAYNEICTLTNLGILSGHSDKLFAPDITVTKAEAYKIITAALGYEVYAESKGGYPSGYLAAATRAEITDGVSDDEEVTIADMFVILYNALTAPVMKKTSFSENPQYEVDENDTVLSMYRDIYYKDGVVTGADRTNLDGEELDSNYVCIDGDLYISDVELGAYLGEQIEFFYQRDEKNDENRIIWAKPTGKTDVLNIVSNNDTSFDRTTYELTYTDNDKEKKINFSRSCVVVYNGRVTNSGLSDILNLPKFEAKFIKGESGTYDIAIINAYENYMVKSLNENNFTVYDKLVSGRSLNLNENEYEKFDLNLLETKKMEFLEIQENNILSVYMSLDGDFIKVSVSTETISGTIDRMSEDENGGKLLTINDTEYYMSDTAIAQSPIKPAVGQNYKFYLDITGDIAYCEMADSSFVPMYITNVYHDDGLVEKLKFKYVNMEGKIVESESSEKLKIDSVRYNDVSKAYQIFKADGVCKPQFVLGKFNSEGEIVAIDTVRTEIGGSEDLLNISIPYQSGKFYKSDGLLNTYGVINETTFIFSVPLDSDIETAEDYEFKVIKKSAIPNDSTLNFETYKTTEKVGFEQYMVVKGASGATLSNAELPILVDSFSMILNNDGEIVEALEGWQGVSRVTIKTDGEYSFSANGIENGDIVRIYKNSRDEAVNALMCFDYSENAVSGAAPPFNAAYTTAVGYVNDVVDDVVRIGYSAAETVDITLFGTNVPILVVNSEGGRNGKADVYKGTLDDARTYADAGTECSKIFVMQRYSAPKFFVIYN